MRVIAGSARSLVLSFPKGTHTRPTTDAMREALFASLAERVEQARFADLYAGSGSVGIEALSRGAEHAVFLEKDNRCVEALRRNLHSTHLEESATVIRGPVERHWSRVAAEHGPFDIVFADPPYDLAGFEKTVMRLVVDWEGVAADGLVVIQCPTTFGTDEIPQPSRVRRYGESEFRFYER
jgi:16S rRNA (guanine966-N2)-methyltransferase